MNDALPRLTAEEARVLGVLVEKQLTTPDAYPLSLHALTAGCNQLTNREPVVAYDENTVVRAADGLREKRFATLYTGVESRVAKYRHALPDAILLTPAETALLCVLLLRGPQTPGELRARAERLCPFDSLAEVEAVLTGLAGRQPEPLVARLPRQPGTKEARFVHLLADSTPPTYPAAPVAAASLPAETDRMAALERDLAAVRAELAALREQWEAFRRQFD